METDPVSETLCSLVFSRIPDDGQSPQKPVIPCLRLHDCLPAHISEVKVNVKLSVLHKAQRHEDVWESGGLAPRFLNLGSRQSGHLHALVILLPGTYYS
jgi:hypothetical protein